MLILALDTSGAVASCALLQNGALLDACSHDSMLDHSRLLLPLCQSLLKKNSLALKDVDAFAAVIGPGSFTGIRIGAAAVKGFAWAQDKPCAGISSLLAMAWDWEQTGTLCCSIRARAGESYYAVFRREKDAVIRLTEDTVGSDAEMETIARKHGCTFFPRDCQRASGAAKAAWALTRTGGLQTCHEIVPSYLRATQAERMRKEQAT
ncbi:MAG: tRNA (adenosine(37)-N6)-threonylcarbamoyltransferase complex dimerization subunit type 1 TsaB [Clostridia bacterium]|nr:tRNA (adenosine(37)-N6)-threonylcarbamoyltransferase complex dimerization subunit type 1 TsaB [Clostridia bacterium]